MQKHPSYTRQRIWQLASRIESTIVRDRRPVDELTVCGPVGRLSHAEAQELRDFRQARLGDQFGPLWATFWFRGKARVPEEWAGWRVELRWVSHSEATLWVGGRTVQGLNHEPATWDRSVRDDALLLESAKGGETLEFQVEMACNRVFGQADAPFEHVSPFVLDRCDVVAIDGQAWQLYHDYVVLAELMRELDRESGASEKTWAGELLYELNRFANVYDPNNRSTWSAAAEILAPLYARRNGSSTHQLSAIGHAHIDTAWLWPLAETERKCERTFSSQLLYMREYPEMRFACSQAWQYDCIKHRNPELYARLCDAVRAGNWVPVGGTWIEPDCNIPSGESLLRQFLYGQRFFEKEFGRRCREFWNPDVFGYNGQLPQIIREGGATRFLTQKLSWNHFNKPQHHTFTWQGIDGSEVLTHFPPADSYNALVGNEGKTQVKWLRDNMLAYKDHDRSRHSLMLFGYGDGGGGPTRRMLETLRRARDLQALPQTVQRSSDEFFELLEQDCTDRPTVVGELYFEFHRGTYTTQAAVKRGNRKSEWLLHDIELLASLALRLGSGPYPAQEIEALWKTVLLNQFHDILPGSSITLVYEDAHRDYARVELEGKTLVDELLSKVTQTPQLARFATPPSGQDPDRRCGVLNTLPFDRNEVVECTDQSLAFARAPAMGFGEIARGDDAVVLEHPDRGFVLQNRHLRAELDQGGRLVSLVHRATGREALAGPGNVLQTFDDQPTSWDAWDVDPFHLETTRDVAPAHAAAIRTRQPLRCEVEFRHRIGKSSSATVVARLDADSRFIEFHCEVDWSETATFLKVAFPVQVRSMNATYEMQYGSVERPTHYNTTYDLARFEVPLHRWMDLSEHGFGVAVLSESKYGGSVFGGMMRLSLLRGTKYPDPRADQGTHRFAYAVMPHAGGWRESGVVREAMRFNCPLRIVPGGSATGSIFRLDDPNLILDTVKKAEDSDALILRVYECHGARGAARLESNLPFSRAVRCNGLEDELEPLAVEGGGVGFSYRPYQILTIKLD